jgi:1-pyrroline-5-carboxylate dehydrogenase
VALASDTNGKVSHVLYVCVCVCSWVCAEGIFLPHDPTLHHPHHLGYYHQVKLEDAGFDWKILGPDVQEMDFVSWTCDQDAYACSGQKCSAQSILFTHENWAKAGIYDRLKKLAGGRKLSDLTIGPVLSHTNDQIFGHMNKLLEIPGSKLLFGGKPLKDHTIPACYGSVEPTAVFVPIDELLKESNFKNCVTEIFGPFQVVTEYKDEELPKVLEACERMSHHLTAAVVSNDPVFSNKVLGSTVNGTTYTGIRARTTGAPQNHWFGPAGDPRGAGIGTPYAIQLVWSSHREVISDVGPTPATIPKSS